MTRRAPAGRPDPFLGPDGKWRVFVEFPRKPDGKRDRRKITADSRAECARRATKLERERDAGLRSASRPPTVGSWMERWLVEVERTRRPSTAQRYRTDVVQYVIPRLGGTRLDQLSSDQINELYDWAVDARGLSQASVDHLQRVIRISLSRAVILKLIAVSPAANARPRRIGRGPRIHP